MSTLTFKAVIDGIHYDPKKGVVKIQLVASSHVSIDRLVTLGPSDESIDVVLQSAQTKITDAGDPITIDKGGAEWREKAARESATEFPTEGDKLEEREEDKNKQPEDTAPIVETDT